MKFENCDIHDNTIIENATITAAGTIIEVKTGVEVGKAKPVEMSDVVAEEINSLDSCNTACTEPVEVCSKENNIEFPEIFVKAPEQAFHLPNDLTKECVKMAVDSCYTGQPTQLAYVMLACFAYRLSNNLSGYKAFVRSLMLWGLIPYDEDQVQQIANTMGIKVRTFKNPDFKKWGDELATEKAICMEIGKLFESKHCWYRY